MPPPSQRPANLPDQRDAPGANPRPPPRLYAIVAQAAPIAAVFRRGPATWWNVSRWDLVSGDLESGAWFKGSLYPRRCDLSPDGTLLFTFAARALTPGFLGGRYAVYGAVSKLPWLRALAAWNLGTTYHHGFHFTDPGTWDPGEPDAGDAAPLRRRHGMRTTPVISYAAERRRGWIEAPGTEPRGTDWFDERRGVVLVKPRPRGDERLVLSEPASARSEVYAAMAARRGIPGVEWRLPSYALEGRRGTVELPEAVWADWDPRGRLLQATRSGTLQILDVRPRGVELVREHDLAPLRPDPRPAPAWAQRW